MATIIAAVLSLFVVFPAMAGISGSVHDFSSKEWSGGEICIVCHTPHNASTSVKAPLWNHTVSTATYRMYRSPSLKIPPPQLRPGSISRLCLSCHDGTVAVDSFGGLVGNPNTKITGVAKLGTDLSDDHPVGLYWDHQTQVPGENNCFACHNVVSTPDGGIRLDDMKNAGNGLKFYNHRIECATCHDVHNTDVKDVKLLRKPLAGSELCFQCHPK